MKKIAICLLFFTMLLTACGSKKDDKIGDITSTSDKESVQKVDDTDGKKDNEEKVVKEVTDANEKSSSNEKIIKDVKEYILNGQTDKPYALSLNWSKTFLNKVDIEDLYKKFLEAGGKKDDVEGLAKYITLSAPISSNWEEMFKKDVYESYQKEIVSIKHLEGDSYEGYVIIDGKELPYVVVSSRTGYYHGTGSYNESGQTAISKVVGKVQLYEGIYFDSKRYGEDRPNPYCEVVISNITDTSFDFTVNEVVILEQDAKREKKVIFLKNTAVFIGDGTKAAFYGKDYTLNFEFPDDHSAYPIVTDMKITGFKPLEGKIYLNNGIPGHEFG